MKNHCKPYLINVLWTFKNIKHIAYFELHIWNSFQISLDHFLNWVYIRPQKNLKYLENRNMTSLLSWPYASSHWKESGSQGRTALANLSTRKSLSTTLRSYPRDEVSTTAPTGLPKMPGATCPSLEIPLLRRTRKGLSWMEKSHKLDSSWPNVHQSQITPSKPFLLEQLALILYNIKI